MVLVDQLPPTPEASKVNDKPSEAATQIQKAIPPNPTVSWIRGIVGAIVGAIAGFLVYKWLLSNFGAYAGMLPGGMVGIGFGIGAGRRLGWPAGILCAIAGLVFGCWADAATNDPAQSLLEYLQDYKRIPGYSVLMIGLGALASGWFARGS